MKVFILRYGEINLKGSNRTLFEHALHNNLMAKLKPYSLQITKQRNRIFLEVEDNQVSEIENIVMKTPGIENYSIAEIVDTDLEKIKAKAIELFDKEYPVFRITVKRSYKAFPYNSQELARNVGAAILIENDGLDGMGVKMHGADQEIGIEVHEKHSYIYPEIKTCIGGLPIGSSGRGIVLLSGGIDSPVAAIEAMKRGIKVDCIHFSTPPYTSEKAMEKVKDLVKKLHEFDPFIKLFDANMTEMQLEIQKKTLNRYAILLMRRMMFRTTSNFALKNKYKMIITGEALGQVASQTIESLTMTNMVSVVPIIRPLITANKNDIINIGRKYGTYDISILPYEDACTVFAPKKPVIKPTLKETTQEEEKFEFEELINNIQIEKINLKEEDLINQYI